MTEIPTFAEWCAGHPEAVSGLSVDCQKLSYLTDLCIRVGKVAPSELARHAARDEGLATRVFRWAAIERVGATALLASVDPKWAEEFAEGRVVPRFGPALAVVKARHGIVDQLPRGARGGSRSALERLDTATRAEGTISYWEKLAESFLRWEHVQARLFQIKEDLDSLRAINHAAFQEFWHRYPRTARMFQAYYPEEFLHEVEPAEHA